MISIQKTIVSALAATSTMTTFSYFVSRKEGENFKEPRLLGGFVTRTFGTRPRAAQPMGWALHYAIGIGFAAAYKVILGFGNKRPDAKSGLLYGILAGLFGVLSWGVLFKNHPNPPKTHRKGFYTQLVVAHAIFGLTLSFFKNKRSR